MLETDFGPLTAQAQRVREHIVRMSGRGKTLPAFRTWCWLGRAWAALPGSPQAALALA
jgi:hypothetical protein